MSLLKTGLTTLILALTPAITFSYTAPEQSIKTPQDEIIVLINQELDTWHILDPKDRQRIQDIAYCESNDRQFKDNGSLYRGEVHDADVGIMQINEDAHPYKRALDIGYDIHTEIGNIDFGIQLYKWQGSTPWNPSKPCWSKSPATW